MIWWRVQFKAGQRRSFWRAVKLSGRIHFYFRRKEYVLREQTTSLRDGVRILASLFRFTWAALAFALITATFLLLCELYLPDPPGWKLVPAPVSRIADNDSYPSFLSTISAIGGVLIALYYTGMVGAGSAVYARVPSEIRELLLREPIGKLYINVVSYTTFLALCLLAFSALGFSPIRPAFPLLILLAGVTVLSFVRLGQQAFHLLDPTRLSGSIFQDLQRSSLSVVAGRKFWDDSSFQAHASQRALSALRALDTLSRFSSLDEHLRTDAIADLAVRSLRFLYIYEGLRRHIPSTSKWYPTRFTHADFYLAGDIKADFALRTGGPIQPERIAEDRWVEDRALSGILLALKSNVASGSEQGTLSILGELQRYVGLLGESWELEAARALLGAVAGALLPEALKEGLSQGEKLNWRWTLVEQLCLLPISALMGFVRSLDSVSLEALRTRVASIRWHKGETMYRAGLHRFALPIIEWCQPRIEFERWSDGRQISPHWYVVQLVVRDYMTAIRGATLSLRAICDGLFVEWTGQCEQAPDPWAAAMVINRRSEFLNKVDAHSALIFAVEADCKNAVVIRDMEGWPKETGGALKDWIDSARTEESLTFAESASKLSREVRPAQLPDFAGAFLARTARAVIDVIFREDETHLNLLFPHLWKASFSKFISLSNTDTLHSGRFGAIATNSAPLIDLMEITGYAIMVSEMNEAPQFWGHIKETWDEYLTCEHHGGARIHTLSLVLLSCETPMLSPPGSIMRFGWRNEANAWVAHKLGVDLTGLWNPPENPVSNQQVHPSALIRVIARDSFLHRYHGTDVFGALYFSQHLEEASIKKSLRFRDLADAVAREANRSESVDPHGEAFYE